jgi:hypothetical protein
VNRAVSPTRRGLLTRVTGFVELRLLGESLLCVCSFLKITEMAQFFGLVTPRYKLCINFDPKSGLGYILGHFFTNPSGHLAADQLLFLERRRKSLMKRVMRALVARVARWFIFKPKIQIWVNFGGPWKMMIYFTAIWNILQTSGIFYNPLVHFVFI